MPFPHKKKILMVRMIDRIRKDLDLTIAKACECYRTPVSTYYRWRQFCPEYNKKLRDRFKRLAKS